MTGVIEKFGRMLAQGVKKALQREEYADRTLVLIFMTLRQMSVLPIEARGIFTQMVRVGIRSYQVVITAICTGAACTLDICTEIRRFEAVYLFISIKEKTSTDACGVDKSGEHPDTVRSKVGANYFFIKGPLLARIATR